MRPEETQAEDRSSMTLAVDRQDISELQAEALRRGVELTIVDKREFEPVTAAVILIYGSTMALAAIRQFAEERRGGQVIDLRPKARRKFYRDRNLHYGFVVIIGLDGSVSVEVKAPKTMFSAVVDTLSKVITSLGGSSVDSIEKAARDAVGSGGIITRRVSDEQTPDE